MTDQDPRTSDTFVPAPMAGTKGNNEDDRIMNVIRMTEQERHSFARAIVERCEIWILGVTAVPWIVLWAIVINFYPTEAVLTILRELAERTP